ncbi:MAG: DUF4124 domain-containing protein [Archangiaceae bacterium]|nr:DUF4124 domain-containing protein [Archangiaceae bacterium]
MRLVIAAVLSVSVPALASDHFIWGAGAFNSNYRPPGYTPQRTPSWGPTVFPGRHRQPVIAPVVPVVPYYVPVYPYGSTYYGFQPTEHDVQPAPAPPPAQVVVFEKSEPAPPPAPAPEPEPRVIIVQVPMPAPAAPVAAAAPPAPAAPAVEDKTPPKDVYHWVDEDGVHHYSTTAPRGVKADKVR